MKADGSVHFDRLRRHDLRGFVALFVPIDGDGCASPPFQYILEECGSLSEISSRRHHPGSFR